MVLRYRNTTQVLLDVIDDTDNSLKFYSTLEMEYLATRVKGPSFFRVFYLILIMQGFPAAVSVFILLSCHL